MVCNTMSYRGETASREIVFPLWLALQMALTELDAPKVPGWITDETGEEEAPSAFEAMVAGLI